MLRVCWLYFLLLAFGVFTPSQCQGKQGKSWNLAHRKTNWSSLASQPSAFLAKAELRLKKRDGGYSPNSTCKNYVGLGYLAQILRSKYNVCQPAAQKAVTQCTQSSCESSVDCYTAPFVRAGNASKASVSLCTSKNMVLDSCKFLSAVRRGSLSKKFPLPERGAVKLACSLVDETSDPKTQSRDAKLQWLKGIHYDVWWANATQDSQAVARACADNSTTLVTTPTLFVMRDRHANYAHEMELVSMAFSFLAALEPKDVAKSGMQVVITDRAPATSFLETWARISRPHRLRVLADDPFPPNTCFRSAYHVYTFAAGIGYNTNPATIACESPIIMSLSHWIRQVYGEGDPAAKRPASMLAAEAVAGPATQEAGVRGLKHAADGIVVKNVVWLSRRNLELTRLLLEESKGWKSMRLLLNVDAVVSGLVAAVQEWNAESCLIRRFDTSARTAYDKSFSAVNAVHASSAALGRQALNQPNLMSTALHARRTLARLSESERQQGKTEEQRSSTASIAPDGRRLAQAAAVDNEHDNDSNFDDSEGREMDYRGGDGPEEDDDLEDLAIGGAGGSDDMSTTEGAGSGGNGTSHPFKVANNILMLERLWDFDQEVTKSACRRTNVVFKFVEGYFDDESYYMQLQTIFRTGVLVGVHGAGLAHGFFMPPGISAVLQLLGKPVAEATAANVFRNMAVGLGNYYEDVLYEDVDVDVDLLKVMVKRAMDFVSLKVMEAQRRRSGALRLVLVDQSHFAIVVPPQQICPAYKLDRQHVNMTHDRRTVNTTKDVV